MVEKRRPSSARRARIEAKRLCETRSLGLDTPSATRPAVASPLKLTYMGVRGERATTETVALAAAALTAVYAYFVYYAGALMTETFYILAILWALDLATSIGEGETQRGENGRWKMEDGKGKMERGIHLPLSILHSPFSIFHSPISNWLLLGLALGIAALLRQVILIFIPFLLAWLWWAIRKSPIANRLSQASISDKRSAICDTQYAIRNTSHISHFTSCVSRFTCTLAVIVALIAPWTARNYRAFGRFVLLNTNAGYAFFWANHPVYGTNFVGILPADGPSYQDLIPPELRGLHEAALDQALLRRGLGFVADDPMRYVLLSLSRVKEYFKFWPSSESSTLSNIARVISFGLLLPFMLYGLWRVADRPLRSIADRVLPIADRRSPPSRNPRSAIRDPRSAICDMRSATLLYLFIAIYTAIHLLSWALIRYRLPVDAILIIFAAYGLIDLG